MDRRSFLTKAAVGGTVAAAATTLAAPLYAQGKRTLTMVTTWARGAAGVHDAAQRVADSITVMTDGQITVDLKSAGELVGAFEVFDAVTSGQADMYHGADYYWVGQHPGYAFFTAVPMGMTAQELVNWYYHMGGMELHDELNQIFGLKGFIAGNTGGQGGGWFRKEIKSAADFNGLKFRMPGLGGRALGKLGASVQNIPGGEIYQALASGALDGTEWIGAWADEKMGLQEITKIYYTAGFHEPGAALSATMNREVYESLTPAQQKIFQIAASECHQWSLAQFLSNNGEALARLKAAGVTVLEFPDDVWDAFGRATMEVHAEYLGDPLYKKIYDSAMASMKSSSAWLKATDGFYTAQRDRVMG
jgi:TRAP-type mannitol/chloroaromatic compound transport system substrate-binding protein